MNRKKKIVLLSAVVAAAVVVVIVLLMSGVFSGKSKMVIQTETISRGDMENSVTATGTIEPLEQVDVGTQVSGIIDKIYVDYNSRVKKGEVIAVLDKTVLETELASAQLSVESNQNEYEYQEKNFQRTKTLYEKSLVSESEYETAEYNYRKAKIAYEQSKAQLDKAETNLGYATIYSPIDGVVISKAVEEGQTVASNFSTPTLFTIANDLSRVQVVADVDEADIGQVTEGSEVSFTVDAFPEITFEGVVNQVRMEAITTSNVVTYEVVIHAENPYLKLKPGMTANISIYSMRKDNVLRLPVKATRFNPASLADLGYEPPRQGQAPQHQGQAPQRIDDSSHAETSSAMPMEGNEEGGKFQVKVRGVDVDSLPLGVQMVRVFVLPSVQEDGVQPLPVPRRVKVGVSDRIYYEVLEGLKEGEKVCVGVGEEITLESQPSTTRSPFMPGPPGGGNRNSAKK